MTENIVYVEIASTVWGAPLKHRDEIEALNTEVTWYYEDSLNILEMREPAEWDGAADALNLLVQKYPYLSYTIAEVL